MEFESTAGTVPFPNGGVLTMTAEAEALSVRVTAPDAEIAVSMQGVVARHLDRFAFREAPLAFDWSEPV